MKNVVMKFGGTSVADADAIRRLIAIVVGAGRPHRCAAGGCGLGHVEGHRSALANDGRRRARRARGYLQWRGRDPAAPPGSGRGAGAPAWPNGGGGGGRTADRRAARDADGARDSPRSLAALLRRHRGGGRVAQQSLSWRAPFRPPASTTAWVDARKAIVTDDQYTAAAPLTAETSAALKREVAPQLAAGLVPVIGGYVGATRDGVATTLGRGGSDYSAAIIGAGLGVAEIQIWTDVDGMLTADPRVVRDPRVVSHLSFGEASELAYFGAKVLHPSTILPAVSTEIPVRILNSRRPDAPGTIITAKPPVNDRPIVALACKRNITVVEVDVHAHADGARFSAPAVRGLRALPHGGRRGDDVGGQRVGHDRRRSPAGRDRARAARVRRGDDRTATWRSFVPSARTCASIRRSPFACSPGSTVCRSGWCRRPHHGGT